jgi:hypothetical protein
MCKILNKHPGGFGSGVADCILRNLILGGGKEMEADTPDSGLVLRIVMFLDPLISRLQDTCMA